MVDDQISTMASVCIPWEKISEMNLLLFPRIDPWPKYVRQFFSEFFAFDFTYHTPLTQDSTLVKRSSVSEILFLWDTLCVLDKECENALSNLVLTATNEVVGQFRFRSNLGLGLYFFLNWPRTLFETVEPGLDETTTHSFVCDMTTILTLITLSKKI